LFLDYRQWSNRVPLAYKLSIGCLFFWFLLIGHRLILYSTTNGKCAPLAVFYANCDNYFEVVFTALCPPIVMSALTYLLIQSILSVIHRRVTPINHLTQTTVVYRTVL
jgi:hypothetical protein